MEVTPAMKKLLKERYGFPGRPTKFARDEYNIWLADHYEIKKHELFGKYQCSDKLFDTLEEVMLYAEKLDDQIEREERAERYEQTLRREKIKKLLIGVVLFTFVVWVVSKI